MKATSPSQSASVASRVALTTGFALFVVVIGLLIAPSLVSTHVRTFYPSSFSEGIRKAELIVDTVTVDASDPDAWHYFHLDSRTLGSSAAGSWDLAFQRFRVSASGVVLDLGPVDFATVDSAPVSTYVDTRLRADTVKPELERWYRYGMFSHLLETKGHVYALKTRDGRYAKFQFLSYYCPGPTPGCVTFQYVFQRSGSRVFRVGPTGGATHAAEWDSPRPPSVR